MGFAALKSRRDGNVTLLYEFVRFLTESVNEDVTLSRAVITCATEIRSRYGFKTPDASHLTGATLSNGELFLTNDRRLNRFAALSFEELTA